MTRIDLHAHSTASDGTDSPEELVRQAAAAGVDVLAITDHDTTAGWQPAMAARPANLTLVPGAEFSCEHWSDGRRTGLHLLGYLFDPNDPALRAARAELRANRLSRGRQMVENMVADGVPISWEQVTAIAGGGPIGRPHLGRALVRAGVVPDVETAFRDLLSSRRPYYVRKVDLDVFRGIELIGNAGGVSVFAHPQARRRGPVLADEVVEAMKRAGLDGIEVDHPDHSADDRAHAARLAGELELIATGSSDYHGTNKSTPLAARSTDPRQYERLLERATALRSAGP